MRQFGNWKPLKNDGKCLLLHLKSSFCSQDSIVFVAIFTCIQFFKLLFDQKDKVNFKIYVTTWLKNKCNTHISRSKGNQIMKFGQLIEYIMRNIFIEKSYIKCGGETILRPFSKKSKLSISLDQQFKVLYSLFLLYANLRAIEIQ